MQLLCHFFCFLKQPIEWLNRNTNPMDMKQTLPYAVRKPFVGSVLTKGFMQVPKLFDTIESFEFSFAY